MNEEPNQSIQPTGASRSGQREIANQSRLAPAADAQRSLWETFRE